MLAGSDVCAGGRGGEQRGGAGLACRIASWADGNYARERGQHDCGAAVQPFGWIGEPGQRNVYGNDCEEFLSHEEGDYCMDAAVGRRCPGPTSSEWRSGGDGHSEGERRAIGRGFYRGRGDGAGESGIAVGAACQLRAGADVLCDGRHGGAEPVLMHGGGVWSLGTGGSSGSTGQQSIYSNMYNGGSEYQQPENCLKGIVVPYTAFVSASPFQQVAIATVPGMWSPRVVQVEETSTFASSSGQITTLAASVGTLTNPTYYLQPLAGMQAAPNFKSDNAGGQAAQTTPHTLYLQLAVTNNNPGNLGNGAATNLTAGQLTLRICGVALQ